MSFTLMILANLLTGLCVGITGIAFILPLFYIAFLNMDSIEALALSFSAFFISGILGTIGYKKNGNIDFQIGSFISIGSFFGAILGVALNLHFPGNTFKVILYVMVLLSSFSILLSMRQTQNTYYRKQTTRNRLTDYTWKQIIGYALFGFVTAVICASAGAGGPILVMPILTLLGYPAHLTIGIALFNSIFIALPATPGYLAAAVKNGINLKTLPILLLVYGIGVLIGSRYTIKINQNMLKKIIAITSIVIAMIKLFSF